MFQAHLNEDQLWKGQLYLAGDRLIPEDLAIALNLVPKVEPISATAAEVGSEPPAPVEPPAPPAPKPRTRRKS